MLVRAWKRRRTFDRGGWPQQGAIVSKVRVFVVRVRRVSLMSRVALPALIFVAITV